MSTHNLFSLCKRGNAFSSLTIGMNIGEICIGGQLLICICQMNIIVLGFPSNVLERYIYLSVDLKGPMEGS